MEKNKQHKKYIYIIALLLMIRAVTLPAFSFVDTTEGRYAGIAKNIVDYDNWITPKLWHNGELVPFLGKPPLFFWSSAICMKYFGQNEFAARLPGFLSFVNILLIMFIIIRKYISTEIAWRAVFLLLSSVVIFAASGFVIVDLMLSLGVAGAYFAYFAFIKEPDIKLRKKWSRTVFLFLAIGFMVKGPVAILLFGVPVFAWTVYYRRSGDLKHHAWLTGFGIFLLITAPWFVLAEIKNPGFIKYFFVNENFLRFVVRDYGDKYGSGHEHIRGTAILMMLAAASPWSFYAIFRMFHCRRFYSIKQILNNEYMNFFLFIVAADTLLWSMARQLLMTYLFPLVPAFAVWLAFLIQKQDESKNVKRHSFSSHAFVLCVGTAIALLIAAPVISQNKSTKDIIDICKNISDGARIYFVHDVPYSAYFYAKDKVVPHPDESVSESLDHIENLDNSLCVISKKSYSKLPEKIRKRKYCIASEGEYTLIESY